MSLTWSVLAAKPGPPLAKCLKIAGEKVVLPKTNKSIPEDTHFWLSQTFYNSSVFSLLKGFGEGKKINVM